jgi:hypothetical protein
MQTHHRRVHFRFWLIVGPLIILALIVTLSRRPEMRESSLSSTQTYASVLPTLSNLAS